MADITRMLHDAMVEWNSFAGHLITERASPNLLVRAYGYNKRLENDTAPDL